MPGKLPKVVHTVTCTAFGYSESLFQIYLELFSLTHNQIEKENDLPNFTQ